MKNLKAGDRVVFTNDCSYAKFPKYEGKIGLRGRTKSAASTIIGDQIRYDFRQTKSPTKAYNALLPPTKAAVSKASNLVCKLIVGSNKHKRIYSGDEANVIETTSQIFYMAFNQWGGECWNTGKLAILELDSGVRLLSPGEFVNVIDSSNPLCVSFVSQGPRVALYSAKLNPRGIRTWQRLCFLSREFNRGKDDRYSIHQAVQYYATKKGLPALVVTRGTLYDEKENETWLKIGFIPPKLSDGHLVTFRMAADLTKDGSALLFYNTDAYRNHVGWNSPKQDTLPIQPGREQAILLGYIDDVELGRGARMRILYKGRAYDVFRDQLRGTDE